MSSHITIKDIAKAMGCAPSTVSRALNNSSNISPAVREAIQRYAMEHNYRPNEFALSLRNNRSNTIGVILPQIKHYFFVCCRASNVLRPKPDIILWWLKAMKSMKRKCLL